MTQKIINIVLAFIILILIWKGCEIQREKNELVEQVSGYTIGEKAFKKKVKEDSSTIASQTQTIMTQDDAIKLGLLKINGEIKKIQSQVTQTQEISIRDIAIPFVPNGYADTSKWISKYKNGDTSKEICDSLIANSIIVPKKFELKNKWYNIDGKVKKDGLLIDSFKIINESSVTLGYKKSGFLNLGRTPMVEIINTNPYLDVTKVSNIVNS
jgi:hypothetical protein